MIDLVQLQNDLFGLLMSAPALRTVNIVLERKFLVQAEVNFDTIWTTVRNGRSGTGVLIEMPSIDVPANQSIGPKQNLRPSFVVFQNGDAALEPSTGSGLYAETLAQLVLDTLHMQELQGIGTLYAQDRAVEPAREYEFVNAYRVSMILRSAQANQTNRTAPVVITITDGVATLTCATSGAEIYYTVDGSFPDQAATDPISLTVINSSSQLYAGPFAVTGGQIIRAAAYAAGYNPGRVARSDYDPDPIGVEMGGVGVEMGGTFQ